MTEGFLAFHEANRAAESSIPMVVRLRRLMNSDNS